MIDRVKEALFGIHIGRLQDWKQFSIFLKVENDDLKRSHEADKAV